jgi:hypothetical protein
MRLGERDAYRLELAANTAERAGAGVFCQSLENMPGQKFGRGVVALEFRHVVEIAIIQRRHDGLERIVRAADVDDDAVGIERIGEEGRVDDEGRAVM